MLAILKTLILRMRTSGDKQILLCHQEMEGQTLYLKICCETINIPHMQEGFEQVWDKL